jgi:hypothetical protein
MADRKQYELDRALDATLAQYAAVEPRAGLDDRILANLRAERARVPEGGSWRWGVAVALAAMVIVALALTLKSGKQSRPVVANHWSATTQGSKEPAILAASSGGANQHPLHASNSAKKQTTNHIRRETVVAANPKLDQFPSPQPLSEQELALARYVSEFPEEATLIARTQAEFENEIRQQMKDARSETDDYGSDQQER